MKLPLRKSSMKGKTLMGQSAPLLFALLLPIASSAVEGNSSLKLMAKVAVQKNQVTVSGTVRDSKGTPLPGVTVRVKETGKATSTNVDGLFRIELPNGTETLQFSMLGFVTKEVKAEGRSTIDVTLEESASTLDEVVVIGYGTVKKRDLTGSVVSIREADITATPVNNIMEALQGKIAGADIMRSSGAVGTNASVLLRGTRSIYGDNSPLYIVDGIPSTYSQINPSDIASIDVLKDASSTAIYGSAGANGVIIITTKKGREGKSSIDFDMFYGFNGRPHFYKGMTGQEYTDYRRELYRTTNGNYPADMSLVFTNSDILNAYNEGKWIDWIDEITSTSGVQEKYNLSFSTGVKKTKVYSSFTYTNEGGLLPRESQKMAGFRLNLDHELLKWAKVGTNVNVNYTNRNARNNNIFTKALGAFPLGEVRDADGNINAQFIDGEVTPLGDEIPDQYADNTRSTFGFLNTYVELAPLAGLSLRSNIGLTLNSSRQGRYFGRQSTALPPSGYALPVATLDNYFGYGYVWENTLTYNRTIATDHNVTLTGITSYADSRFDRNNSLGQGQDLDYYLFYNIGTGTQKTGIASAYQQKNRLSFAGRMNYSYKGKYLFSFTNRWDGVSHLAEGHKWASFPAASAAWRISDENFMSGVRGVVSDLKLRAGYGVTGNSGGMDAYSSQTQAYAYQVISLNGALVPNLQNVGTFSNPEITWEKSYNLNVGLDLSVLKDRISLSADVYNTDTKGLLFRRTLPVTAAITAWASPMQTWQNIGETNNRGYELTLRTVNIDKKAFNWSSNFSFTRNKEKIVDLPNGDVISERLFEGHPIQTFYDYRYQGIWSMDEATEAAKYGAQPGYVKVATNEKFTNGVGDGGAHPYTDSDRMILGSNVPKWLLGINNTITFKNFDLNAFAMIRWGQMINSSLLGWYRANDDGQPAGVDYWTPENQSAYFPRPGIASTSGIGSLKYVDGSFVKLKTLTLGYTLPEKIRSAAFMSNARIYATAYNPLVFTKEEKLKGTDPENNGSDTFPLYRTFVLGLNVSF
ncbi:TonB-dependent receptor [Pedobacter sp. SYSU D00535]|uniref:SusC/RagA family TonB-linked outer membrane protein n=1 Tax=Pedobacter sp. SYSU D00535 TaxID=2810308 RepID=UPI001A97CE56|nr:TonB-dependent receptor [Pedobacter sp. SYSU D00535]